MIKSSDNATIHIRQMASSAFSRPGPAAFPQDEPGGIHSIVKLFSV